MKILRNACRIIIGIVFLYSGFVKGIDPLGSTYKFTDYFNAFSMSWLSSVSFIFSIILSSLEFTIGLCLLLNVKIKWASIGALGFMCIFTPLTLAIAIGNPVSDCGCFGDALKISNWQTFFKNIILLGLAIQLYRGKDKIKTPWRDTDQYFIVIGILIFIGFVSNYSYKHLPLIDFRPYKIGVNIQDEMAIPEGAPTDEYRSIFKYKNKKTGKIKRFNETNYPWQDTLNWEYVDIHQKIIKKGFHPKIDDFTLQHTLNGDISEQILHNQGYSFLLISYDINQYDGSNQRNINQLASYSLKHGYDFYCVTASLEEDTQRFSEEKNADFEFCNMDETQLKTIIRSNPGLLLLKNGTIIHKWHGNDIPSVDELKDTNLLSYCLQENQRRSNNKTLFILALLWVVALSTYRLRNYRKGHINN